MQKRRMARWVDGRQGLEEKSENPHISSNELRTSFVTTRHQHAPSRLGVAYACRSRAVRDWGVGGVETLAEAGEDGGVCRVGRTRDGMLDSNFPDDPVFADAARCCRLPR
jgi:hypothetical protein